MKYQVELNIGYISRAFEFDSLQDAGVFAKTVLRKQVLSEDQKEKQLSINIEVINNEEDINE